MVATGSSPSTSRPAGAKADGDIDVQSLSQERIKQLMKADPKFIQRIIGQLDKSMHNMVMQKQKRLEENAAAQQEIDQINESIRTHIQPSLDRLDTSIRSKTDLRAHLTQQIEVEFTNVKNLEAGARALIQRSRHTAGKLMRTTASQRLEEQRGFSSTMPTTQLVKAGAGAGGGTGRLGGTAGAATLKRA